MSWAADAPGLETLSDRDRARLDRLNPLDLPKGARLFQPGDAIQGYAIVLSGRVDVRLTTASGREILLYSVVPGQSCIQSTLGLMGGDTHYTAEAETTGPTRLVLLPRHDYDALMEDSPAFRDVVFSAFGSRMKSMMELLEKLAFQTVECRLAEHLLRQLPEGETTLRSTQAELAAAVGTAREVVSRKLENWATKGWVTTARGKVTINDPNRLHKIAAAGEDPLL